MKYYDEITSTDRVDRPCILVIEDNPDIVLIVMTALSHAGIKCHCAPDGPSGLAAFNEVNPHLVLLDLLMPGLDGRKVCGKIREDSTVPIIVLTALPAEEAQSQSFRCGANDYVTKPFDIGMLVARVKGHLQHTYQQDFAFRNMTPAM